MILRYSSTDGEAKKYTPVPLGNGDLSCFVDYTGGQLPENEEFGRQLLLWRAGRRFPFTRNREMLPFGHFYDLLPEKIHSWSQELNTDDATLQCLVNTNQGQIHSRIFIHALAPLLVIHKSFTGKEHTFCYDFTADAQGNPSPYLQIAVEEQSQQVLFRYRSVDDSEAGEVTLGCNQHFDCAIDGTKVRLTVAESPACFTLRWHDRHDQESGKNAADISPYDEASHRQEWQRFYQEAGALLPGAYGKCYQSALYHLRTAATDCTIPAGGIDGRKWHAGYYPYDAYFAFIGLLSGGHLETAKRTPEFYHRILHTAQLRSYTHWGKEATAPFGADYAWVNDENGNECANYGFWSDHIFHMAHIALSGWIYYQYTGDREFLQEKVLPVMKNCCAYYRTRSIHDGADGIYVGKCTDMERMGPGRERAFQTTCAIIWCLEKFADACHICQVEDPLAQECQRLAAGLRQSFAERDGRYLPFDGANEESVAMLAGRFPFPVLEPTDPKWQKATQNLFRTDLDAAGNMYPIGKGECAWYLGWKAMAAIRSGKYELADKFLDELVEQGQSFSAIFEIVEPAYCPWFCTAEGLMLHAIHERLIQFSNEHIQVLPYWAADYSFNLPCGSGAFLDYGCQAGKCTHLTLTAPNGFKGELTLPDGRSFNLNLTPGETFQL